VLGVLGTVLAYIIIEAETVAILLVELLGVTDFEFYRKFVLIASVVLVIMPLSFMKNLSGLRIVAILSIVTLLYVAIVIVVEFPFYYEDTQLAGLEYFRLDKNVFTAFAL
jgi:amino acid permease